MGFQMCTYPAGALSQGLHIYVLYGHSRRYTTHLQSTYRELPTGKLRLIIANPKT